MRYVLMAAGLAGILGGLFFANNAVGVDALAAATLIICGVVALSTGLATEEILTALKDRTESARPEETFRAQRDH
jgi:hypothetical protein